MRIKFTGPVLDASGYAENARQFIWGLHHYTDNKISVEPVSFESHRTDYGPAGQLCHKLSKLQEQPDYKIINLTPEHYPRYLDKKAKNIGYTTFETDRIPDFWVRECNKLDAVFTTSSWCRDVFIDSGIKVPVFNVPPGIDVKEYSEYKSPLNPLPLDDSLFKFYSIFQWTERKNPEGLLTAYWTEFTGRDDVVLILKTYKDNTSESEQKRLIELIKYLKNNLKLSHYPSIYLIGDLLSRREIIDLHLQADCFVLPQRAEGFGMPHFDAMALGKPIITTGYGGSMEFTKEEYAHLIDYRLTPVKNMPWCPWYEGTMNWADADILHLRKLMRQVFENKEDSITQAIAGQEFIFSEFSWETRISHMVKCMEAIS